MTAYVLDASVASKWVLPSKHEPLADESIRLLDGFCGGAINLSVPDLFWPEIGNILWKSVRAGRISEQSALDSIDWLQDLQIPTSPTRHLVENAVMIGLVCDRTVYDALYVALAVASGRPLVTADERFVNAIGARFPVRWLGSLV